NGEHQTEETDPMLLNVSPATPGAASQAQSASVGVQPAGAGNAPGASTQAAKTSAMINPPHGEPGHDCAVAVGAPLPNASGAPASPDVQPLEGQSPVVETKIVPNPDQPAIRMNPPHGQPGHDCAVAVGAPLPEPQERGLCPPEEKWKPTSESAPFGQIAFFISAPD